MSIQNELNRIKHAIKGEEVRGAIHDGIKRAYDDASVKKDNANMEVKIARGYSPTLGDRLNKIEDKKISVKDIDKNLGKFDQTYMSEELLQQMAGEASINAIPADDSIGMEKLSFTKLGSVNRFDKRKVTKGRIVTNGEIEGIESFYTSDFISLVYGDVVYSNQNLQSYNIYNSNLEIIKTVAGLGEKSFKNYEGNGVFVRVSFYHTGLDDLNIAINTAPPQEHVEYKKVIDEVHLPDLSGAKIIRNTLDFMALDNVKVGKNLYNKERAVVGYYVAPQSGHLIKNDNYYYTDYMPVKEGRIYSFNYYRFMTFYDVNFDYIDGLNSSDTGYLNQVEIPNGVAYVVQSNDLSSFDKFQFEEGKERTSYEPYNLTLNGLYIDADNVLGVEKSQHSKIDITLPSKVYGIVGKELNIYFNNIFSDKVSKYDFDVSSNLGKHMQDRWTSIPTEKLTTNLSIRAFKDYELIKESTTSIEINDIKAKDETVLVIGDSTINAGLATQRALELYSEETSNLSLLGVRGSGENKHEGRGGWSARSYRQNITAYDKPNPFYNPLKKDFDFSYYMSEQNYSSVNHVILVLGINETFGYDSDDSLINATIDNLSNIDYLINSIHEFDSTIKVGVSITIPPNSSQDAFGHAYGNGQKQWRYKRNNALWVKELIKNYEGQESLNIHLVPMQHNIDTTKNIADGVHPNKAGYDQMGDSVYYYLKSFA